MVRLGRGEEEAEVPYEDAVRPRRRELFVKIPPNRLPNLERKSGSKGLRHETNGGWTTWYSLLGRHLRGHGRRFLLRGLGSRVGQKQRFAHSVAAARQQGWAAVLEGCRALCRRPRQLILPLRCCSCNAGLSQACEHGRTPRNLDSDRLRRRGSPRRSVRAGSGTGSQRRGRSRRGGGA